MLAGVAWYGVPRIVHGSASGAQPPHCSTKVQSEPTSAKLDQRFVIDNNSAPGDWARVGPCDGRWYQLPTDEPPDLGRWYFDGAIVDVDCARVGATYRMTFDGRTGFWSTWLHIRGGMWIQSILGTAQPRNGFAGLPTC